MSRECKECGIKKPLSDYSKNKGSKDGHVLTCKPCAYQITKSYKKTGVWKTTKKPDRADLLSHIYENKPSIGCQLCGIKNLLSVAYDYHHIDPNTKFKSISNLIKDGYGHEKIKEEIDKCIIICSNCHRQLHFYLENNQQLQQKSWHMISTKFQIHGKSDWINYLVVKYQPG